MANLSFFDGKMIFIIVFWRKSKIYTKCILQYKDQHENFTIVAIDAGDPAETVGDFVKRYNMSFPVWVDPGSSALNSFRNNYLPSSYLITKEGQVIMVWSGAVTRASLEENITPLLRD